ncbi:MAG: DeoR/GlpR family DNA-binding transcription regulator [Lachnospiraceae bacterium]
MKAERQTAILDYIKNRDIVKNSELEIQLKISKATLNRDLIELEERGLLQRTHGGVIGEHAILTYEPQQLEKELIEKDSKIAIAKEAVKLIERNSSFILDSGSTLLYLAREIVQIDHLKSKIFATNDLKNAMTLSSIPDIELVVFGGKRRKGLYSMCGDITRQAIEQICTDIYFMGADAIDIVAGVTNVNFEEVAIKRSMAKASKTIVLLVDHTKFSKTKVAKVCDISEIDIVITDDKISAKDLEALNKQIETVIVAGKDEIK